MMEQIHMDTHKLLFHPQRVVQWLDGKSIYPIEVEIGLSGACNHRCVFCAVDYIGYQAHFMNETVLLKSLRVLADKGLKSVIFSGEGEPLLNKNAVRIFNETKKMGIDIALATNGVLFTKDKLEECLESFSWIRFSIAAGTAETYEKIQTAKSGDFNRVLQNLRDAVAIKRRNNLSVTLGAQMLLLPENADEVTVLAGEMRDIGIDYLAVKPYSQHPQSKVQKEVHYEKSEQIAEEVERYQTDNFKVYFRRNSISNLEQEKSYDQCYALPFMTHIDAQGNVFPCVAFVENRDFCYGNIYECDFDQMWESEHVRNIMSRFSGKFLKDNCRKACRLDEMNKYLYELKHPGNHVNFI